MNLAGRVAARVLDATTLSRKILDRELVPILANLNADTVLDVGGAGGKRVRVQHDALRYWTVDVQAKDQPSTQADAHLLPVASGTMDVVLSVQVLEHCRDPRAVVEESCRVLKAGGQLVLSTVLMYELHAAPLDYYRFTATALTDLARSFASIRLIPLGNRFVAAYDLTIARSVALNSLLGRAAYTYGTRPSEKCPTGFILVAEKGRR